MPHKVVKTTQVREAKAYGKCHRKKTAYFIISAPASKPGNQDVSR